MKKLLLAIGFLFVITPALAITITDEDKAACYDDAVKFCGQLPPNYTPRLRDYLKCGVKLVYHVREISGSCYAVLKRHGKL